MTDPIELLIFDCDGVLVDSEWLSHRVLQQMLAELGVILSFDATVERFIGSSLPVCMARVGELLGGTPPQDFVERFGQRTHGRMGAAPRHTIVIEDTPTGIAAAKAAGMRAIGFAAMTPGPRLAAAGADALAESMNRLQVLLTAG